mmetsp:Transcript_5904/g.14194  ORF Transcript_5904/g.14194 Transcript_5904/m.14194 type:complete len:237 (+) Transcript_5904:1301-2011(+)
MYRKGGKIENEKEGQVRSAVIGLRIAEWRFPWQATSCPPFTILFTVAHTCRKAYMWVGSAILTLRCFFTPPPSFLIALRGVTLSSPLLPLVVPSSSSSSSLLSSFPPPALPTFAVTLPSLVIANRSALALASRSAESKALSRLTSCLAFSSLCIRTSNAERNFTAFSSAPLPSSPAPSACITSCCTASHSRRRFTSCSKLSSATFFSAKALSRSVSNECALSSNFLALSFHDWASL